MTLATDEQPDLAPRSFYNMNLNATTMSNGTSLATEMEESDVGGGGGVVNCSLYYNYSMDEDEAERVIIPCTEKWSSLLSKYSFATEGVGLFTVAIVGKFRSENERS